MRFTCSCDMMQYMDELKKNELYTVSIEGYSSEAFGICRIHGQVVFVPGTIMGETWEIRILKVTSHAAYGKAVRCINAAPSRLTPDCPHYGRCGGCDTRHMSYEEELRFKLQSVNDAIHRIGKQALTADTILACEHTEHYRNKAIFAVADSEGEAAFGFYRERSHELISVRHCALQSEIACRAADAVISFMRENGIAAYDEETGRGTVRHVFCRNAVHGDDIVLCIVSARGFGSNTAALVAWLREKCPELTGIVLNINKSRGNTVLGGAFHTLWGDPNLHDTLCGLQYSIAPQAFFQVNPPQAEKLYQLAVRYAVAETPSLILDLYCGAGTISLCMAQRAAYVIGAEIVPEAVQNAAQNAERNGLTNVEFICADAANAAEELARRGLRPDVVVVDPPRKGLSEEVIDAISEMEPSRIVYVSCNPATLARDLLRFQALAYAAAEITAVDMFPRTSHVETVCCLYHQKKDFISVPYESKDAEYLKRLK